MLVTDFRDACSGQDLLNFLRQHNALVTESEVFHLVRQLDLNGDGRICYSEFLNALMPVDAAIRSSLISRGDCGLHEHLPHDCCFLLANLLMKEIEVNRELEVRRKVLFSRPDFKLLLAFRYLEEPSAGQVTPASLAEVSEAHNHHLTACDLELIFRRMDR
ncbi:EF hand protein [Toxoplasma gondii GAB2-2007-GAL-DOM2]|uniref:EF hand protein n=3 Tax=Toxoplasma gondii TaxID=5811 RepID=V4Z9D2_TOXGV|nr:EF hand protein [Toxoplasma gondii VEG]KFG39801.1 EF hand protein [Toxoplasma gondii GAB2-2007-GAL-DOM2]